MYAHLRILLFGLLVLGAGAPLRASSHTNIQTLFLILMENVSWPDLVVGTNAPYLKTVLIPQSSYCSNMFIVPGTFGSLPQYLWLESGTNWGVATDSNDPVAHHFATTNHFVIQLQNAGISWKAYQEGINGTTCPTTTSGLYAAFHNPFVYFDDIYLNVTNCTNRIRPYAELERDLTNNAVARYNFITPNLCHDMHGGSGCPPGVNRILLGDQWLATEIPKITNSPAYRNHGAIIITWDEGTANVAGPFGTIVLSPEARGGGFHLTNRLDHTATFRTLQEIFGVPFLFAARNATGLGDLFLPTIQLIQPLVTNGHWQVTAMGVAPGRTNVLQFAADFEATHSATGWENLLTNVPVTNRVMFLDPADALAPRRYYRVIEPR